MSKISDINFIIDNNLSDFRINHLEQIINQPGLNFNFALFVFKYLDISFHLDYIKCKCNRSFIAVDWLSKMFFDVQKKIWFHLQWKFYKIISHTLTCFERIFRRTTHSHISLNVLKRSRLYILFFPIIMIWLSFT